MRINAISSQNYQHRNINSQNYSSNALNNNQKAKVDYNTNIQFLNKNYNQTQIHFKGTPNLPMDLLQRIPLEDRLASILENIRIGDLVLVGKNLQECAKSIYKNASLVPNAIKRGFYIAEQNMNGRLGFIKNPQGDIEALNLGEGAIRLHSGKTIYTLKPDESFYVVPDDILHVGDSQLKIKDKPKADLSIAKTLFCKNFDYEQDVKAKLVDFNKKTLSQLITTTRKPAHQVTFEDVGGLDTLKTTLKRDIIYPIKYPDAYEDMKMNHGFILYGPPGTGKTHIARALANEAHANFISLNGLDLESKWVGASEENWRNLFAEAKEHQPTIIFLDEFDAVARSRDSHDEYGNKVVNQLLTLMTDIDNENSQVYVIGATNNYKSLDSAITRSGRFGKHYEVTPPDFEGLKSIFRVHTKNKPLDKDVNVEGVLKRLSSVKATGADVKHIVNEAHNNGYVRSGIYQKMDNNTFTKSDIENFKITQEDFDTAINEFLKDKKGVERPRVGFNK